MPIVKQIRTDRRNRKSCWLLDHAAKVTSQFGEDGIVAKIFELIGEQSGWCVEFGPWDGKFCSNTHDLVANRGWSGVLIEGSPEKFAELRRTYAGNPSAVCVNGVVQPGPGKGSLDEHLARTTIPREFDLLSIDIDGNDYFVWESLTAYRPRLVVIEFNPGIPNDIVFVQDRGVAISQGCSLRALIELGKEKGYELAVATATNGIFVTAQEFAKLGIADNDIDSIFFPPREGKYFDGYDGTLYHVGASRLHWHKDAEFGIDELQFFWPAERVYGGGLSSGRWRKWKRRSARFLRTRGRAMRQALKRRIAGRSERG
ncbi:MAG: hypothetical protein ACRED5_19665 [Propylenella sp.]